MEQLIEEARVRLAPWIPEKTAVETWLVVPPGFGGLPRDEAGMASSPPGGTGNAKHRQWSSPGQSLGVIDVILDPSKPSPAINPF
jgi:hypothetical protein